MRSSSQQLSQNNQQRGQKLKTLISILKKQAGILKTEGQLKLKYQSDESLSLFQRLSEHRKYLIAELLSFFPLNPISEVECCIVNIKLSNSCVHWIGFPPEVIAAALGYLMHLIQIIIDYMKICLPYTMLYFGSRSLIWRDGSVYVFHQIK